MEKLQIDAEFKTLIRPLSKKEYLQLEENILTEGCSDALIVWGDIIVDGYNRYEICTKYNIDFRIKKINFKNRDEATIWICKNQLGRRNITEETRKFLIGLQYELEKKLANERNPKGNNQHTESENKEKIDKRSAIKIAEDNNIHRCTVEKYGYFTKALETIGRKYPELKTKILSGKYKISQKNLLEMAEMTPEQLQEIDKRLSKINRPFVQYSTSRSILENEELPEDDNIQMPYSIKAMPKFDPDASITEVSLTMPSWASSIIRAINNTNFNEITQAVRKKTLDIANMLLKNVQEFINILEKNNEL